MRYREFLNRYSYKLFVIVMMVLIVFLRLYKLSDVPVGLHIDEAGMAYDAWCLLSEGTDRWLNSFPVYLNNTGKGQSILYCLICMLCYRVFGVSMFAIRLPQVIFSVLTIIYGMKLVNMCYEDKKIRGGLTILLFTLVPYFTQNARYGLDCNLMLGTFTIFLYCFVKAIKSQKIRWYVIAGIAAGIVLYSYIISYITLPIFLFVALVYVCWIKEINWKGVLCFCIPLGILACPLLLVQIVNIFQLEDIQIGIFTFNKLGTYRTSEFTIHNIVPNLIETIKCMVTDGKLISDAFPKWGTFYPISLPFYAVGGISMLLDTIKSIKRRTFDFSFFILSWIIIMVALGCLLGGDGPRTYRFNAVFFALLLVIVEGIIKSIEFFGNKKYIVLGIIVAVYGITFGFFIRYYFAIYPKEIYPQYAFQPELFEVVEYYEQNEKELQNYDVYLCLNHLNAEYYALAAQVSPKEYYIDGQRNVSKCNGITFINDAETNIDANACYIVWEVYYDFIDRLSAMDFRQEKVGKYIFFIPNSIW